VTQADEPIRAAIADQAGEWFIQNQAGPLSSEDSIAFFAWLKASPIHVQEYLGVARIAVGLGAAVGGADVPLESFLASLPTGEDTVVSIERPRPKPASDAWRRAPPRTWRIAASLLALAIGVLWWAHDGELLGIPKAYRTAHGEQRVEHLPDGSVLHLDTDSAATVRYSGAERVVELKRGQALFEVTHDKRRRFRLVAGEIDAIARGTRFNVYRSAEVTTVTVAEGEVEVFTRGGAASSQLVTGGFQARVAGGILSAQPAAVDLHQVLGWLQHKIVFEHRPLGEVAAEFNRYGRVPIEIEDETLRALPVSGTFDADDTDSFVAFLETLPDVRVQRIPTRIRVVRIVPTT
jgi:transmembrane sensor